MSSTPTDDPDYSALTGRGPCGEFLLCIWHRDAGVSAASVYLIPDGQHNTLHLGYWSRQPSETNLADALWATFLAQEDENVHLGRLSWMPWSARGTLPPAPQPVDKALIDGDIFDMFGPR